MSGASASMPRILFLLSSTRAGGNTEILARRAAQVLPATFEQEWVSLIDLEVPRFIDQRHGATPFGAPEAAMEQLLQQTLRATDIVFVAPTYWYSLPWPAKLYLDHWTAWLRAPGIDFREKMRGKGMWAVTVNADEGTAVSEPLLESLRLSADYMEMTWHGGLVGHGSKPGDVLDDAEALAAAQRYFSPLLAR